MKEVNEIKEQTNKLVRIFVYRPQDVYIKKITKNETDICVVEDEKVVKLSCRIWQDNYYNRLVSRARLDIFTFPYAGEGEHVYISSQYDPIWEEDLDKIEEPDDHYKVIEKTINSFYDIYKYREKKKELEKESADISPGSPMDRLNEEFYGKIEELMLK